MLELQINDENFNHHHYLNNKSSPPTSAWTKSLLNCSQTYQNNYQQNLFNNYNTTLPNQNFFHVNEEFRNINKILNNINSHHNYGTTTSTCSHGVGGNGISSLNGDQNNTSKVTRSSNLIYNMPSKKKEFSSCELSVDDNSTTQHINLNKNTYHK